MQRYLAFFSYIGTRFRGAQAQLPPNLTPRVPGISRLGDFEDRTTVQGLFNIAITQRFKPLNTPVLILSSRTDTGVHALSSSGHFDMLHPRHEKGATYKPNILVKGLNRYFDEAKADISVQQVLPVPDTFHSRYSAAGRSYLYRLGVVRPHAWPEGADGSTVRLLTPISERHRSYIAGGPFCMSRLRQCAALLTGEHDFRAFMGSRRGLQTPELLTRRGLEIEITPGATAVDTPDIQFWNIHFRSQGFLFRQVRRTVGVLVACARGRMTLDDVQYLLDHPDKDSWNSQAATAPPHGLYLSRVTYHLDQVAGEEMDQTAREEMDQVAREEMNQTAREEMDRTARKEMAAGESDTVPATERQGCGEAATETGTEGQVCVEDSDRDRTEESRGASDTAAGDVERTRG